MIKEYQAIFNSTGKTYKSGVAYHTVYPAPGAAIDWVYSSGVPLSFVIAPGDQGFLLPPEQIEGTCKEVHAAAKALSKYIDPDFVNRVTYYGSWF
ncbi:Carboxypeptidase B2 [Operophtera brumata]|uniref:Carboxypeptidase B2 n=1 Tax=Operophtera brumata TaxID=104452 RepID=A0A0L7LBH5_OPEBR|nr:Carboxypeptidase B2 [Operophtera brumata]